LHVSRKMDAGKLGVGDCVAKKCRSPLPPCKPADGRVCPLTIHTHPTQPRFQRQLRGPPGETIRSFARSSTGARKNTTRAEKELWESRGSRFDLAKVESLSLLRTCLSYTKQSSFTQPEDQRVVAKHQRASWLRRNTQPLATAGDEQVVSSGIVFVCSTSNFREAAMTDTEPEWLATNSRPSHGMVVGMNDCGHSCFLGAPSRFRTVVKTPSPSFVLNCVGNPSFPTAIVRESASIL